MSANEELSSDMSTPGLTDSENEEMSGESDEEPEPEPEPTATSRQLRNEGNFYFNKEDYYKAIAKYREALKANPPEKCHRNISLCYSKMKSFRPAVDEALLAVEDEPSCAKTYIRCGMAYMELGNFTMAGVAFLRGLAKVNKSDEKEITNNKEWRELRQGNKNEVCLAKDYIKKHPNLDIKEIEEEYDNFTTSRTKNRKQEKEKDQPIRKSGKRKEAPESNGDDSHQVMKERVPDLVFSSNDDSDDDTTDISNGSIESEEGAKPHFLRSGKKTAGADLLPQLSESDGDPDSSEEDFDPIEINKKMKNEKEKNVEKRGRLNPNIKDKILANQKNTNEKKIEDDQKEAKRKRELDQKKENDKRQQEEKERDIYRKREQEKLLQEQRKVNPNQEIKSRFEKICNEASTCLINTVPSVEGFTQALEMATKEYKSLWTTSQYKDISHNEEIVVIKYMLARACVDTNNYDYIMVGLKKLDEIRDQHKPVRFPTVFYGLATLWKKLNRFDKALAAVNDGIEFLERGFSVTPHNWPGIASKLVEETRKDALLEKLTTLKTELKYPPKPNAVCRWKDCIQIQSHIVPSEKIFISDPDFKGYFKIICRMGCQVCYHKACWMAVKGENIEKLRLAKVPSEKDFLGQSCFTPDCKGVIVKIEIFEDNFTKVTNIQDTKLIEKLEDEERKRKEETRLKKEREEHEKRVKIFEKKQMKRNHEKHSYNQKEKAGENNVAFEKNLKQKKDKILNWRDYEKKKKGTSGNCEREKCARKELICCYPDGCSQQSSVLNVNDLSDTQRMTCSNSKCDQSKYMHLACFQKFEAMVVAFLKQQPRCRAWTQQQCLINLWKKKGYEVAVKKCGCLCGHGKIRKDLDWTPPKSKAGDSQEGAAAIAVEKFKKEETVKKEACRESSDKMEACKESSHKIEACKESADKMEACRESSDKMETSRESSISQNCYFEKGEKSKQNYLNIEPTDISHESIESDKCSKSSTIISPRQVSSPTSDDKGFTEVKKKSDSIITLDESEETEEIYYSENETASANSTGEFETSFESSQQMKEKYSFQTYSFQTDIRIHRSNLINNNGKSVACKENDSDFTNNGVSASSQTDLSLIKFGHFDPETMQKQNENLILEIQEMKDKFYKTQSERKIEAKEYNDNYARMSEDHKNLKIENASFKDKIGKMKKTISEATKMSDELKKSTDSLKSTRSQLEEANKRLREEESQRVQLKSQLTSLSQEKQLQSQLNDLLRAKMLQNDLKKYRDIIRQKQENNSSMITHLLGSRELNNLPQIQLALSALNEYSARLLLADEQLNRQYATLVRQAEHNKTIQELQFDLASVEPPNLGPSCLNLLHNFVILSQTSSRPTASPFSFPPPAATPQSSASLLPDLSSVTARGDARGSEAAKPVFANPPPGYAALSTPPGSKVREPSISRETSSGSTSNSGDSFQTASAPASDPSLSPPSSPGPRSSKQISSKVGASSSGASYNHSGAGTTDHAAGATSLYPTSEAGATSLYPTSATGATSLYPTSEAGATALYPTSEAGATSLYPTSATGASALYPTSATGASALYPTSATGASALYPTSEGASALYPTSATGASALYPTSATKATGANASKASGSVSSTNPTFAGSSTAPSQHPPPPGADNLPGAKPRSGDNVDSAASKPGKKYDKLIGLLQKNHQDLSPSQALDYVMKLRKANNGKLTGMSIQDILDRVAAFIQEDQDKDCSICFEDMDSEDSMYLQPCRHRFHKACINQWLESPGGAGSTCPMCRNYIVKEDEFPDLGAARRF